MVSAALGYPAAASAHAVSWRSAASIRSIDSTGAAGNVRCAARGCPTRCLGNRPATLFRVEGGRLTPVGRGRTNASGAWSIETPLTAGQYQVLVNRKILRNTHGHLHQCRAAASRRVRL